MNTRNTLANFSWFVFFLFVVFAYGGLHLSPTSLNLLKIYSLVLVVALNTPLIINILKLVFQKSLPAFSEIMWLASRLVVAVLLFKDASI